MATKKNELIPMLEEWFSKAPALPTNIRETLVKIAPVLSLIFGILGIIGGLGVVGVSPLAAFGGFHYAANVFVGGILIIISSLLLLMAYPGLSKRKYSGWNYVFWSEVISFVGSLAGGGIVNAIIGALIGFYILFQIKSYYK